MNVIDLEPLLAEISPDAPSGEEDLMGDPEFIDLEIKVKGTPEQEFDKKVIKEAAGPNWHEIKTSAINLLSRTHDLRVAMILTRALLNTNGLEGFCTGLTLIHGLIERYWESLYPQLDPEDDFDPMIRSTILETMSFGTEILGPLKLIHLCASPALGRYNFRDILIALGKLKPLSGDEENKPDPTNIEAAFKDTELEILLATHKAISFALEKLAQLEAELKNKIGDAGSGPDLRELHKLISKMNDFMQKQLENRMPQEAFEAEEEIEETITTAVVGDEETAGMPAPAARKRAKPVNEISNRQDVIRSLDLICTYYQRYEPGSPVPLLLKRARQLVDKSFLEILQDLAPESLEKINNLIGAVEEQ